MLVDASQFPGPAMFQGIGLIAIGVYVLVLHFRDKREEQEREKALKERERLQNEAILKIKAEIAKRKEERDNWPLEKKLEYAKLIRRIEQHSREEDE